jgi:hypothetical protein
MKCHVTECTFAPGLGQLHRHVNWTPATFVGKLTWRERSADQDQDLQLKTLSDYDRASWESLGLGIDYALHCGGPTLQ